MASYYNISVDGRSMLVVHNDTADPITGKEATDAAWYYQSPKTDRAAKLKDFVAFCKVLRLQRGDKR